MSFICAQNWNNFNCHRLKMYRAKEVCIPVSEPDRHSGQNTQSVDRSDSVSPSEEVRVGRWISASVSTGRFGRGSRALLQLGFCQAELVSCFLCHAHTSENQPFSRSLNEVQKVANNCNSSLAAGGAHCCS